MSSSVKVRRQKRRSLMMRAVPGGFEVYIPHYLRASSPEVQRFIDEGLRKLGTTPPPVPQVLTPEAQVLALAEYWAERFGVRPARVQLREMRRKWGSCSARGTVTLARSLCWLPPRLAEYVIAHEMAHLIELNHSPRFWALLASRMPDYEARLAELRAFERGERRSID